jgi:hypothetical protein
MYNQPPAASFGGPNFGGAQGIIDTNGYPQPPAAFMPTQQFGEHMPPAAFAPPQGNWQPPATGFAPPPPTDASGFPIAAPFEANSTGAPNSFISGSDFNNAQFVNSNPEIAEVESFGADDSQQQLPPQ